MNKRRRISAVTSEKLRKTWTWLDGGKEKLLDVARPMLRRILEKSGDEGLLLHLGLLLLTVQQIKNMVAELKYEVYPDCTDWDEVSDWRRELRNMDQPEEVQKFACARLLDDDGRWTSPVMARFWETLLSGEASVLDGVDFEGRISELCRALDLDTGGAAVLRVAYLLTARDNLKSYLNDCFSNDMRKFYAFIAVCGGVGEAEVHRAVSTSGPIFSLNLMGRGFFDSDAGVNRVELSPVAYFYLDGIYYKNLQEALLEKVPLAGPALGKFRVSEDSRAICIELLRKPGTANVLLYGGAGLGKTSFCKALARELDRTLYQLKVENEKPDEAATRLRMAVATINPEHDILLVDEADTLLNSMDSLFSSGRATMDKGWLNQFLESNGKKVVWITNRSDHIEESTMRRFDFCCGFRAFDDKAKEEIWRETLDASALSQLVDEKTVRDFARRYALSPANIKSAVRVAAVVLEAGSGDGQKTQRVLEEVVRQQARAIGHGGQGLSAGAISDCSPWYGRDLVNSDLPLDSIVTSCRHFLEQRKTARDFPIRTLSLLLYGLPGTGKTEFAKHLAGELGKKLILKKASDLLSMWVGGTEHLIAAAFDEAREQEAILFIDEADSLLSAREGAQRSWEITQVNELLVQMENHEGITIFSTNFEKILDKASLRRFSFKIRFAPLKPEQAANLFQRLFAQEIPDPALPTAQDFSALGELTFGDFKVIHQRLLLGQLPAEPTQMLAALRAEASARSSMRRLGF